MQLKHPQVRRRRLPREQRHRLILEEAVRFFAEVGFEGQTRVLAERLGVTQPLLYRYFPDKEALIARVFDEVYVKRWSPDWGVQVRDRSQPLAARLHAFYRAYYASISDPHWIRIFTFPGLKREQRNGDYFAMLRTEVLDPICAELHDEAGVAPPAEGGVLDYAWHLHGSIFNLAAQMHLHNLPIPRDLDRFIADRVTAFLDTVRQALRGGMVPAGA